MQLFDIKGFLLTNRKTQELFIHKETVCITIITDCIIIVRPRDKEVCKNPKMTTFEIKTLTDADFLNIIKNTPLVSIDLILFNTKNEILLGLRKNNPAKNYWFVPGGRILKNETLGEAFRRIAFKEVGLDIELKDAQLVGVFDHMYEENKFDVPGVRTHYVSIGFKVEINQFLRLTEDEQHSNFKWINKEKLLSDETVHPNTKAFFMNYIEMTKEEAVNFWLFQSKLLWSRIQTAAIVEAGGLASWYQLFNNKYYILSIIILLLSAILLFCVSILMNRDKQYMDYCGKIAGTKLPRPQKPLFGWSGRYLAIGIPLVLGILNIFSIAMLLYLYWNVLFSNGININKIPSVLLQVMTAVKDSCHISTASG